MKSFKLEACQLWCSHGGVSTPCHYDGAANFLLQLQGRKRVVLLHPREFAHVYPYPVGHPMDNFAMVDAARPDVSRFPALANARGRVAEPTLFLVADREYLPARAGKAGRGKNLGYCRRINGPKCLKVFHKKIATHHAGRASKVPNQPRARARAESMTRACPACTLLCEDASRASCELCGAQLATCELLAGPGEL